MHEVAFRILKRSIRVALRKKLRFDRKTSYEAVLEFQNTMKRRGEDKCDMV